MFIQTEQTPNPQTLKFLPGRVVMKEGTAFYKNTDEAVDSPFAKRLFAVDGVKGVFFGSDFITTTKSEKFDWQIMKPIVLGAILDHFNSDDETINSAISNKGEVSLKEMKPIQKLLNKLKNYLIREFVLLLQWMAEILYIKALKKELFIFICKDLVPVVLVQLLH